MRYAKQFTVSLGNLSTVGSLWPIRVVAPKYSFCTDSYEPVRQAFIGPDGKEIPRELLKRGRKVAGSDLYEPVGETVEIQEARKSTLEKNVLAVTLHTADEVNEYLYPSDNQGYVFEPVKLVSGRTVEDKANELRHDLLHSIVEDPSVALVGKANLNGHEGLFRISLFQGKMSIQKQMYPRDINDFNFNVNVVTDPRVREAAQETIKQMTTGFNPSSLTNSIQQRLDGLANGTSMEPHDYVGDLLAELDKILS